MPVYQYQHDATGEVREEIRSVDRRDELPGPGFRRLTVPVSVGVCGGPARPTLNEQALAGYYKQECTAGSQWRSTFSKAHIKRVFSDAYDRQHGLG